MDASSQLQQIKEIQMGIQTRNPRLLYLFKNKLDESDIRLLKKFYFSENKFPLHTQPFVFQLVSLELGKILKIDHEGVRHRLEKLFSLGLLTKLRSKYVTYFPVKELEEDIRNLIKLKIKETKNYGFTKLKSI